MSCASSMLAKSSPKTSSRNFFHSRGSGAFGSYATSDEPVPKYSGEAGYSLPVGKCRRPFATGRNSVAGGFAPAPSSHAGASTARSKLQMACKASITLSTLPFLGLKGE